MKPNAELHCISILYDGEIVVEGAWNPFLLSEPQMMHSLSKTVYPSVPVSPFPKGNFASPTA
ncbi:MAG: hypothetical protein V8S12_00255 [Lachnospiraceae bacterium]